MSFDYFYGQQSDLFTFYRVPKVLFTNERFWNISADAKMLYGILLDRMSLSAKNGWIDKNGRVYIIFTIDEAKMALNCAEQKAIKLLSELEKKAGFRNEFDVTLKGAVSHRVALGTDARGNITRLDNALAGIPERLERANEQLNNLYNQQEAAKAEVGKPFPQEAELTAKSQRLAELDAALNMEDSAENRDERSESERPSVLADLKSKAEHIPPAKYSEPREEVL